ncbi:MAG: hypothetical protein ACREXU_20865 [Gammaproteobacteria bacterium]
MSEHVSPIRLNLLRVAYFLTFAFLGARVWPEVIAGPQISGPLPGVAVSLYAALSVLCVLGLRYPLAMLPLLLLQLTYKTVWLIAVALPLGFAGPAEELSALFAVVVALDLAVIPWRYVAARFVRARGDAWKASA